MHGSTVSDCIEHYKTCLKDFLLRLGFIHTTIVELSVVYLFKNIRHFFIFLDRDIRKMKQVANIMRHPLRMSCKTFSLLVQARQQVELQVCERDQANECCSAN
jgi:hypothetical protein